jgi:hypothetical protein
MTSDQIGTLSLWLNTIGLCLGIAGEIGLALLSKSFITINPNGSQTWGPGSMPNDLWLKRNIRIRWMQRFLTPLCCICIWRGICRTTGRAVGTIPPGDAPPNTEVLLRRTSRPIDVEVIRARVQVLGGTT